MRIPFLIVLSALGIASSDACGQFVLDGYLDQRDLVGQLNQIADSHSNARLDMIGATDHGNGLFYLTLSSDTATAGKRPAILITAGLDGRHLVGTETAWRVAQRLVTGHRDLLERYTVYIVPRANPDGMSANMNAPAGGHIGTLTPVDDDRDGAFDEDGPVDINNDGMITMIRRLDPPLNDPPTHLADPAEPRLLRVPDAKQDHVATYTVYTEGLDQDGDGRIAEDGVGQVDLDQNFMHRWPEYEPMAGRYQLSEVESLALAKFVLDHSNIVAAITYGRHDTLVNPPDGKGKDITGRAPKNIDGDDVAIYTAISESFKEITGQSHAPKTDNAGSFHSWLYAQRGIPSFSTVVWGRSKSEKAGDEASKEGGADDDGSNTAESGGDPISGSWVASFFVEEAGQDIELAFDLEQGEDGAVTGTVNSPMGSVDLTGKAAGSSVTLTGTPGDGMTVSIALDMDGDAVTGTLDLSDGQSFELDGERTSGGEESATASGGKEESTRGKGKKKAANADEAAWLKYFDATETPGFIVWQPFDHPTLGAVEIGGFAPLARMNPPADQLDNLADAQTSFVVDLASRLPELRVTEPEVTRLADDLYEVRIAIVNDGMLPARTAMARSGRTTLPTIVMLSTPVERIVAGERLARVWSIAGHGGRSTHHWIIRTEPAEQITVAIRDRLLGERIVDIPLN